MVHTTHNFLQTHSSVSVGRLHYANVAQVRGPHNDMQSIESCFAGSTTLYTVRACCTVYNTHAEHLAMVKWLMYGVDLLNSRPCIMF